MSGKNARTANAGAHRPRFRGDPKRRTGSRAGPPAATRSFPVPPMYGHSWIETLMIVESRLAQVQRRSRAGDADYSNQGTGTIPVPKRPNSSRNRSAACAAKRLPNQRKRRKRRASRASAAAGRSARRPPPRPAHDRPAPRRGTADVRQVETPGAALHLMEIECPVDPLPEVAVLDRHHLAEMLPLPSVMPPLGQPLGQAAVDVTAGRDERHAGGLGQSLEPPHHGQQLETLAADVRLFVAGFELVAAVNRLEDKSPLSPLLFSVRFRKQQEMWFSCVHTVWRVASGWCRAAAGCAGVALGRGDLENRFREGFCHARPALLIGSGYPTALLRR